MEKKQKKVGSGIKGRHNVDDYVREITGQDIPVRVVINNNIILDDCRLVCRTEKEKELFIQAKPGDYPQSGDVSLTCAYLNSLYSFKSRIVELEIVDPQHMHLKIQFPENILKEERRKHIRVEPTESNPIQLRLARPDSDFIDVETMDISRGGVSFVMTEEERHFKTGDELYLDISLPKYGNLYALAAVRNVIHLMDITRIGVEFSHISEDAYKIIMQYVTALELEKKEEEPGD